MAEEKTIDRTKRVFINNLDSFASKYIAKTLSVCVVGGSLMDSGVEEEEEEKKTPQDEHSKVKESTFQIVGTVSCQSGDRKPHVLEEYYQLDRDALLQHLLECDVIIYNISEQADQVDEASWAVSALHSEMGRFGDPKMFILLSTVMTWALTKPLDPDDPQIPFTEEDYRRRKTHPNFKEHLCLEKLVVKLGKTRRSLFSTYVVASGLQYGMGEQIFHFFFKASWLGDSPQVPVFGDGHNIIPCIHIQDLASVLQNVIDHKPNLNYLVAVDDSKNTIEDIVKAVAAALGPGRIGHLPQEDAFLIRDLQQRHIDSLLVNLHMEAVHLKDKFNIRWVCESGLVENIEQVVEEYKQTRGLLPIRLCVLGPPAVGKSTVAERICKHYKLQHITLKTAMNDTLGHLESLTHVEEGLTEGEESDGGTQDFLDTLRENMDQNEGRLDDQYVIRIMREKLKSKPCRNQGFVLDGFPKSYEQAKELFCVDDDEPEDTKSKIPPYNKKIAPDFVLSLEASDEFLKNRVLNLPESVVEGTSYSQEQFLRRLASFREMNVEDETVLNYFDELDIHPVHIGEATQKLFEITSSDDQEYLVVMERIINLVGKPKNYGPSSLELEEEERRSAQSRLTQQEQQRAEEERKDAEEAELRTKQWEEWCERLEEMKRQEHDLLEAQSVPLRSYLMSTVLPTLTQGLIQCCRARPEDPIHFLAEYLFKNNPQVE